MKEKKQPQNRKPYAKPVLKTVNLSADEVLAVGCKIVNMGNNSGVSPCLFGRCARPGTS